MDNRKNRPGKNARKSWKPAKKWAYFSAKADSGDKPSVSRRQCALTSKTPTFSSKSSTRRSRVCKHFFPLVWLEFHQATPPPDSLCSSSAFWMRQCAYCKSRIDQWPPHRRDTPDP